MTAICRFRDDEDGDRLWLVSTCVDDQLVQTELVWQRGSEILQPVIFNREGEASERSPPEVIARVDLAVGQAWRWEGESGEDQRRTRYRVANRGQVFTPFGAHEGVRLLVTDETPGSPPAAAERWYVPGIGLVKEAGAVIFPLENGGVGMVELVRMLREHGIVPVDQIGCCQRVPGGDE